MEPRINAYEKGRGAANVLYRFANYLSESSIEQPLIDLISYRASQINGCAFCLDMHSKDLRAAGETEQRIYLLDAWREVPFYSERERAALAWTEAVTNITEGHIPDEIYEEVRNQFSEEELIDLTLAVIAINSYNRFNVAFRTPAGDYFPGQFAVHSK
jgi:AhpD family alkylhydroperoxidase